MAIKVASARIAILTFLSQKSRLESWTIMLLLADEINWRASG